MRGCCVALYCVCELRACVWVLVRMLTSVHVVDNNPLLGQVAPEPSSVADTEKSDK